MNSINSLKSLHKYSLFLENYSKTVPLNYKIYVKAKNRKLIAETDTANMCSLLNVLGFTYKIKNKNIAYFQIPNLVKHTSLLKILNQRPGEKIDITKIYEAIQRILGAQVSTSLKPLLLFDYTCEIV